MLLLTGCNGYDNGGKVTIAGEKVPINATTLSLKRAELSDRDLENLASLKDLEELNLYKSNISDLTPISGLKKLRTLDIGNTDVTDLTPLADLSELEVLSLFGCDVKDISPLAKLPALANLDLGNTSIPDLSPLLAIKSLRSLSLAEAEVDYTNLAELTQLESLNLMSLPIDDLTLLSELTNLKRLELTAETATNITPLLTLKNLEYLTLWGDEENLGELAQLGNLKSLILYTRGNVDYEMLDVLQKAIPGLHIELEGHKGV